MEKQRFKTDFAERIFRQKYAQGPNDSWDALAERVVEDVCGTRWKTESPLMSKGDREQLAEYIKEFKFIPGGRYLYYAGREAKFFNNCYLLKVTEDTREEWANVVWRSMNCLASGGGIGCDYSILRPSGKPLLRTGGVSSGPLPLMFSVNEIGRCVMQGGSRRSAIYASLNWKHEDIPLFLKVKNWPSQVRELKEVDFNFPATLDMTNISINYDNKWLEETFPNGYIAAQQPGGIKLTDTFLENCKQALQTGEPGFSFNFGDKENETLRNALIH